MAGSSYGRDGQLGVGMGAQEAGRREQCGGYGAGCRGEIGWRCVATAGILFWGGAWVECMAELAI